MHVCALACDTQVARRYLKGWFIVDLSAAFPTQLISLLTNGDGVSKTVAASRLPRLLRIPRMLRMLRYAQRPVCPRACVSWSWLAVPYAD